MTEQRLPRVQYAKNISTDTSAACAEHQHELCGGVARTFLYGVGHRSCQCECHHAPRQVDPDTHRDAAVAAYERAIDALRTAISETELGLGFDDRPGEVIFVPNNCRDAIDFLNDRIARLT